MIATAILLSCHPESDDIKLISGKMFELEAGSNYTTLDADDWLILHDKNGAVVFASEFQNGSTVVVDSLPYKASDRITVTLLHITYFNGIPTFSFTSYLGEEVNSKWTLRNNVTDTDLKATGEQLGTLTVQVEDVMFGPSFESQLSNRFFSRRPEVHILSDDAFAHKPQYLSNTVNDYFLFVVDENDIPRYKFLEDVDYRKTKLQFKHLDTFDKIVEVEFPSTSSSGLFIQGYEEDQVPSETSGYYTNYYYNSGLMLTPRTNFKAGYLNRFSKYRTKAFARYKGYSYEYNALGGIPASIEFPLHASVELQERDFTNFSFSSDTELVRRSSSWFFSGIIEDKSFAVTWEVNAPGTDFRAPQEIPEVILNRYPSLRLDYLKHQTTRFYTAADSWETYLDKKFKDDDPYGDFVEVFIEVK